MAVRTQYQIPAVVVSCSLVEAEVAELRQRSVKWTGGRSEVPGGKANAGDVAGVEGIVVCRFAGCKIRLEASFRAQAYSEVFN